MNKKFIAALISASIAGMFSIGTATAKSTSAEAQEVIAATTPLKQQVELCIFDQGFEAIANCATGKKASDFNGMGWDLSKASKEYETKYVESIDVQNGVIIAKAKKVGALNGESFMAMPKLQKDDEGNDIGVDWVMYEEAASEEDIHKSESVISKIALFIADNYKLFRKANINIDVPAGEKSAVADDTVAVDASEISKFAWTGAKLTYENKFGDPKFASSALTLAIPELKAYAKDGKNVLFTIEGFKKLLGLECTDVGLCTAGLELSANGANEGEVKFSDLTLSLVGENVNMTSFMNNVCGDKNTALDLVSLNDLVVCLDDSDKSASALLLLGENFKLTAGMGLKIDTKPINLTATVSLSGNKPSKNFEELLPHSKLQLLITADKAALDKLSKELGEGDIKSFADVLDPKAGDSYKIELICEALSCKVNGVPLEEVMQKF